jgi:hypothetical protein
MPGDLLVAAADAADVVFSMVQAAASPTTPVAFHAPHFIGLLSYVAAVRVGDWTAYVVAEPVPLGDASTSGSPVVSPRTAAAHLRATEIWRRCVGDAAGADARRRAFVASVARLLRTGASGLPPASRYASVVGLPYEPLYSRFRRSQQGGQKGQPQPVRYKTPSSASRAGSTSEVVRGLRRFRGGWPDRLDGRVVEETVCGSLKDRASVLAALRRAAKPSVLSEPIHASDSNNGRSRHHS